MRRFLVALISITITSLLPWNGIAQPTKLEHLKPVEITELEPSKDNASRSFSFSTCSNEKGVVGYLLEPKESLKLEQMVSGFVCLYYPRNCGKRQGILTHAGISEVRQAEILLAKVLDTMANHAVYIEEAFTAPRFNRYMRQYLFFKNPDGELCVFINFLEENFEKADCNIVKVYDGGDSYWHAILNLSKKKMECYNLNGPEIIMARGRAWNRKILRQKKHSQDEE